MTHRRFLLIIAAVFTLIMGVGVTPAIAQDDITPCCFTFNNTMSCTITFCVRTPNGPACVTVPGNTSVSLTVNTDCASPGVYVTDICGNIRVIPVNGCTIANLGSCCPRICMTRDVTRCWQITTSFSPLCYGCPANDLD